MNRRGALVRALPVMLALAVLNGCGGSSGDITKNSSDAGSAASQSPASTDITKNGSESGSATTQSPTPSSSSQPGEPKGAEAESARPTKDGQQTAVLNRVPGSTSQSCRQATAKDRDLRIGSFVVGPIDTAVKTYGKKQPGATRTTVRLYWVPKNTNPMKGLTLRMTNLATGKKLTVRQTQIADAEQWKFYDTQLKLDQSGSWRIKAASGPDHGCVIITLPRT